MDIEEKYKKIGICPICGKGSIVKTGIGYSCNYFHSINDKCDFVIYKEYFQTKITEGIVLQLIANKITEPLAFINKKNIPFTAILKVINNEVKVVFDSDMTTMGCCYCGGDIKTLKNGYACENFFKQGNAHCNFWINKVICEKYIPVNVIEQLLSHKISTVIDGFKTTEGKSFSSRLRLDEKGKVSFDGKICKCPKCNGDLYVGEKNYHCSNYRDNEIKCDFTIFREISGKAITPDIVKTVCEEGITHTLEGFKRGDGTFYNAQLLLNENYKIKIC